MWPTAHSGEVLADLREKWCNIDQCLRLGFRGLPGDDSLATLLVRERGHRNLTYPPDLTEEMIAAWAVAHRDRTGDWPAQGSGAVEGQPWEFWANIDHSLLTGHRGLPGGSSLARFLERRFGVRNLATVPTLSEKQIVAWADEHRQRTGRWPAIKSGPVAASPGETWAAVDDALRRGTRGLPGGSSLVQLLVQHREVRNHVRLPPLTVEGVLSWADDHHARTGQWPTKTSGPVLAAPGELWQGINNALKRGRRGFRGGGSLSRLLAEHGRKRRPARAGGPPGPPCEASEADGLAQSKPETACS